MTAGGSSLTCTNPHHPVCSALPLVQQFTDFLCQGKSSWGQRLILLKCLADMRAGSRYNEGQVCAQGEERHFEVLTLASRANLCHILLIGKLETIHRSDSKCAEFTLTWLNSATKMIYLVSKGTRNSVFLKLQL